MDSSAKDCILLGSRQHYPLPIVRQPCGVECALVANLPILSLTYAKQLSQRRWTDRLVSQKCFCLHLPKHFRQWKLKPEIILSSHTHLYIWMSLEKRLMSSWLMRTQLTLHPKIQSVAPHWGSNNLLRYLPADMHHHKELRFQHHEQNILGM